MELTHLLPLLASLQMLPRPVSPADPDPAPQLTVSPPQPVYITGETVTLTCAADGASNVSGVRFFRDTQTIHSKEQPSPGYSYSESIRLSGVSGLGARVYSCESWRRESGREIPSERSRPISIRVTDPDPAPQLTVSPLQPVYITGETVTLTCSSTRTPTVSGVQFFRDDQKIHSQKQPSPWYSYVISTALSRVGMSDSGAYSCESWKRESGREIPSVRSRPISIAVTDLPPQPALRLDPPSRAVSEGLPLLITCAVSGDTSERRFHFYKDGAEIIPGDAGSEISTMEPGTSSRNVSVLSIPRAGPNNTGEFTCEYEQNVSGRWIPSPRSQPVNVTVNVPRTARHFLWPQVLVVGGSFFLINGLIFLVSHCCF